MPGLKSGRKTLWRRRFFASIVDVVEMRSRSAWRQWLERNHRKSSGVWLVYFKECADRKGVGYEDSVREALCFGWIDSLIKRIDGLLGARSVLVSQSHCCVPVKNWDSSKGW